MNNSLHRMEYIEFTQYLNLNLIEYIEKRHQDNPYDMVEVFPLGENYASRKFNGKNGKQEKGKGKKYLDTLGKHTIKEEGLYKR